MVVKPNAIELMDTVPHTKASEVGFWYKEANKVSEPIMPTSLLLDVPFSELKNPLNQLITFRIFHFLKNPVYHKANKSHLNNSKNNTLYY